MSTKHTSNMSKVRAEIEQQVAENVSAAARLAVTGIREQLQGRRSGREYPVPRTNRTYTASAPGEAPARRTGDLAKSYRADDSNARRGVGHYGSRLIRALWLERGTRNMAPRPHFERGVRARLQEIKARLSRGIT